ncbi:MAG: O-antigen ligase family protein, partial [Patescibacteria group bacterium]
FILINILAIYNAPNIERSTMVLLFIIFTSFVALLIPNLIKKKENLNKMLYVLFFSYSLVTIFGIYQFLGDIVGLPPELTGLRELYTKDVLGFPRVQSTALEPLYFANYLLLPFCLLLTVFLTKSLKLKPYILASLVALGGLNLVLTVSRGAYIAFAASLIIVCIFLFKKVFTPRNIIYFIIVVSLVSVGAVKFLNLENALEDFTEHTQSIFEGASYEERVDTFSESQRAWSTHPLIGIGPGSFGPFSSSHPYVVPQDGYKIVNNVYLEILAESGILGLALFILIIIILIIRNIKAIIVEQNNLLKALHIGLMAAFIGILVQYNTFSILYIMHIWFTIGLMIACQNMTLNKKNENS